MATIPTNSWVSSAGVRVHRLARASATAIQASAAAVSTPIIVSATPLPVW